MKKRFLALFVLLGMILSALQPAEFVFAEEGPAVVTESADDMPEVPETESDTEGDVFPDADPSSAAEPGSTEDMTALTQEDMLEASESVTALTQDEMRETSEDVTADEQAETPEEEADTELPGDTAEEGNAELPEDTEGGQEAELPEAAEEALFGAAQSAGVEEGTYAIVAAGSTGFALDIRNGSLSSGALLQLYKRNQTTAQIFFVKRTEDGYYTLQAANSGLFVNVHGGKAENRNTVQQYRNDGTNALKWKLVPTGDRDGSFYIRYYNTRFALDIAGGKYQNGTSVRLYQNNRTKAQKFLMVRTEIKDGWKDDLGKYRYIQDQSYLKNQEIDGLYVGKDGSPLAAIEDGVYVLHAADSSRMVLDVEGGSAKDKANVQLYAGNATGAQRFRITAKGNGYYTIVNAATGKALDVAGGMKKTGQNVIQYRPNGSSAQLWRAMRAGPDGSSVKFVSKGCSLCLSRKSHGTSGKTNVALYYSYSEGDAWNLVKSTAPTVFSFGRTTYQIVSAADTNKVIDVKGASHARGAVIQIYQKNSSAAQHFRLHKCSGGVRIQAEHSAKYLNVKNAVAEEGRPIIQYIHDGTKASVFVLVPVSETSNDYYIQYGDTDYVLGIRGGKASNGAELELQKKNGSKTQKFRFVQSKSTKGRNTAAVRAEEILNRIGWSRGPAFNYGKVPYQTFNSNEFNGLEWNANYGYMNRRGNCFIRAAQFCMMARVMGEEAYLIRGYVPTRTSRIRHGWVEIETENGPRVFDVSYNSYGYPNTYNVAYGQKGTYRYTVQGRVE